MRVYTEEKKDATGKSLMHTWTDCESFLLKVAYTKTKISSLVLNLRFQV